jgi:hypothetical protein
MFNGAIDRYEWKLNGKKEIYIPYNNYRVDNPNVKYADILKAGHVNQDLIRYELHRVWNVTATLKKGERHIYATRDFYLDEDSWQAAIVDHYDGRGNLWRVAEGMSISVYPLGITNLAFETLYDMQSGRYLALGMRNEERKGVDYGYVASENEYTPAALRRAGVR